LHGGFVIATIAELVHEEVDVLTDNLGLVAAISEGALDLAVDNS